MTNETEQNVPDNKADSTCKACNGTGVECSGVCHCGEEMNGYHDNHSPVEMVRACESCRKSPIDAQKWTAERNAQRMGELRKQEAEAFNLPSQRVLNYQLEMVQQRGVMLCQDLMRKKLDPSCPPQYLAMTEDQVMQGLMNNPAVHVAAILRFLDDMYLLQLQAQESRPGSGGVCNVPPRFE